MNVLIYEGGFHVPYLSSLPIRESLREAIAKEWDRLGHPGSWWNANERLAIAQEVRNVHDCLLCKKKKAALSPNSIKEMHEATERLSAHVVDVIHRIVSDNGRLTKTWFDHVKETGMNEGEYVELVGVIATTITIDTFSLSLNEPLLALPNRAEGKPSYEVPTGADYDMAWVKTILVEQVEDEKITKLYEQMKQRSGFVANIMKAMTLVPAEQLGFTTLMYNMYHTPTPQHIEKLQIETLATVVSSFNECFY
jgi:hypothetical protein